MRKEPPKTRLCSRCGTVKPFESFARAKTCHWGRSRQCKECSNKGIRLSDQPRPSQRQCTKCHEVKPLEEFRGASNMRWGRGFECLDCYRAYRSAQSYDFDKASWSKVRREENHLAEAAYAFGAAAKKRGALVRETVIPLVVLEEADGVCGICGEDVDPFDYHVDHIVPILDGGEHCYENVQLAHPLCNVEKGHADRRARVAA